MSNFAESSPRFTVLKCIVSNFAESSPRVQSAFYSRPQLYGDPRQKKRILGWDEPWIYNILSLCEEDIVLSYDIKITFTCAAL